MIFSNDYNHLSVTENSAHCLKNFLASDHRDLHARARQLDRTWNHSSETVIYAFCIKCSPHSENSDPEISFLTHLIFSLPELHSDDAICLCHVKRESCMAYASGSFPSVMMTLCNDLKFHPK